MKASTLNRVLVAVLAAGVFIVPTLVPVDAANREHQQLMADLRMLQEQTQQLQFALGTLADTLKTVTAKLDDQSGVNRKAFADQKLLVDNVAGDVRVVREKIDDTNVRVSSLSQEVEALRLACPPAAPAPTPPQVDPVTGEPVGPAVPTVPVAPPAPMSPGMSPQRLYDSAWADYTTGQWALAIAGFETYIKTFPKSEMADDAQFYIGQAYYADGRFKDAVGAFDKTIQNYPDGSVVPEAYYKRGLALDRLGQTDRARESYEVVLKKYPDTPAAGLAKQALDRLNRPPRQ